jgi:glyoxylase-like metal-dependent hydrolase (beta-lactamase superfamily II)/ubiquinone/menaquinone biosynthesis C-methylase UbiE
MPLKNLVRKPEILKVTDRVYSAIGFSLSNAHFVIVDDGVVVIDTTESPATAKPVLREFRKMCDLPIRRIIYTHFHGDHVGGASVFHSPETEIIAQRKLPQQMKLMYRLLPNRTRMNELQFGFALKPEDRSISLVDTTEDGYLPPTVLFDDEYRFEQGNIKFQLYHTQGETVDHLMVWLPQEKVLFPGDLFYSAFPMLNNPMKPDRPVLAWAESIEQMQTFHPQHLVPSHSRPRHGVERIHTILGNYAKAIRYVHDETVNGINQGLSPWELARRVRLPEHLANLPYLQQTYGTVRWAVRGIYRQYTGWFDGDPADLHRAAPKAMGEALLRACGGPGAILKESEHALEHGASQLALQLTDIVLNAIPQNRRARSVHKQALDRLAEQSQNRVEKNIYLTAAKNPDGLAESQSINTPEVWPSTRPPVPAQARFDGSVSHTRDLKVTQIAALTRFYDQRMLEPLFELDPGNEFANWGYWLPGTNRLRQASKELVEQLLAFIPIKSGTILDVGCGKGATTRYLQRYFEPGNITGINISEKQIRRCRLNAPRCRFIRMDATQLTFKDNSFDNVISVEAAQHFNPKQDFIERAWRVLKPGGHLVVSDILSTRWWEEKNPLLNADNYVRSLEEYRGRYVSAGFEQVKVIDATYECFDSFCKYAKRLLQEMFLERKIGWQFFVRADNYWNRRRQQVRYYVLVSARKPSAQTLAFTDSHAA